MVFLYDQKIELFFQAFSAITVFFVMLFGVRMIPYGSRYCAESIVALRRIQALLLYPPYDDQIPQPKESGMAVCLKDAVFSWDAEGVFFAFFAYKLSNCFYESDLIVRSQPF